jgi:hypothetical protein
MLRIIFRFIGLMLLAAGFAALVVDGTRSIAGGEITLTSLRETATMIAPAKFALLQPALEKKLGLWAWNPVATLFLSIPTWIIVGGLGLLLVLATRRRAPQIGYSSR